MYQTGDLLIYGSTGVCRVLSIDRRQDYVDGIKQDKLYYQLKPLHQGGVIYTPVDNSKVVMRPVISREEAEALIDTIPTLQPHGLQGAHHAGPDPALSGQSSASIAAAAFCSSPCPSTPSRRRRRLKNAVSAWWTSGS